MLDIYTIHMEHVILLAFFSILTLANWRINRGTSGIHWFFGYSLFLVVGMLLMSLRGSIPDALSVVAAYLAISTGYLFLYLSVVSLTGRSNTQDWLHGCCMAVTVVVVLYFGAIAPNTQNRLIAWSVVLGLQQAQIGFLHAPRRGCALRSSGTPMACVLTTLALMNLLRVLFVLHHGVPQNYLASGVAFAWIEIVNTALRCSTMVAYVWVTASMLRRDLEVQANTDPLTGLLNRRAIERFAMATLLGKPQLPVDTCVITMDLDGFKQINDTLGHACGDETLIRVAHCLRAGLRAEDLIARLGGDEFAIVLPRTALDAALPIAEHLRVTVAALAIPWGQVSASVTASIGLAQYGSDLSDWEQVVTACDHALYAAKRTGGNRVVRAPASAAAAPPLESRSHPVVEHGVSFRISLLDGADKSAARAG